MTMLRSLAAGAAGAATTNLMHEAIRRSVPGAPRVDLLGMQSLAKIYRAIAGDSPVGRKLYVQTLAGDLLANRACFSLVGIVPPGRRMLAGLTLGLIADAGAVALPPKLSLSSEPTSGMPLTRALTVARSGSSADEADSRVEP